MRALVTFVLFTLAVYSQGQSVWNEPNRFLTFEQNQSWLATTKSLDKLEQWNAIKLRLFSEETSNTPHDSIGYSPTLIVNGILFNHQGISSKQVIEKVHSILTIGLIEQIDLIDQLSEEWIFCKPFAGVVILKVDKMMIPQLLGQG